jgi:hypothetical protein
VLRESVGRIEQHRERLLEVGGLRQVMRPHRVG